MPPFPYRLAAIDLDDTLLGTNKAISPENAAAVARLQSLGCRVVLASGRRHGNMLPFAHQLNIDDFIVSAQGAQARHVRTPDVLHNATLSPADVHDLTTEGLARGFTVFVWRLDGIFAQARTPFVDFLATEVPDDPVHITDLSTLFAEPADKIIWAADPAVITATRDEMQSRFPGRYALTITTDQHLEFNAPNANKDDGVAAIAAHYAIPREQVLTFGDGNNDAPMLAWAGMGIAMPHARPAAKQAANQTAPDSDPNVALAKAIDNLIYD